MKGNKLSPVSKLLAVLGCVALVASLFVPLWRIDSTHHNTLKALRCKYSPINWEVM